MKKLRSALLIIAIAVIAMLVPAKEAKAAAYPSLTTVAQVGFYETEAYILIEGTNAAAYNVYVRDTTDYTYKLICTGTANGQYRISNLAAGQKYTLKIQAVDADGDAWSTKYLDIVTKISTITNLHQERWWKYINKLEVAWNTLTACDYYEYKITTSAGKKACSGKSSGYRYNGVTVSNIKNDTIYVVKVRAVQTFGGVTYTTPWATVNCFIQPTIKTSSVSSSGMTIKWTATKGASSYIVYATDKKNAKRTDYKKIASVKKNKTSYTISKINKKKVKSSKTYYIYVATKYKSSESQPVYIYTIKGKSVKEGYVNF